MITGRRAAVAVFATTLVVVLSGPRAGAHALIKHSDPGDGALLKKPPSAVTITFTEPPDPGLSLIRVLDSTGAAVSEGRAHQVEGEPALSVPLSSIGRGTYTVVWRTVSKVDGHVTGGSFSFGVGVRPQPATAGQTRAATPGPSVASVVGRWGLYWGLALLFGGAVIGRFAFAGTLPGPRVVLTVAWALAAGGVTMMLAAERSTVGASWGDLLSSETGSQLVRQAVGVIVCGVLVGVFIRRPAPLSLALLGGGSAATLLFHAMAGHAGAQDPAWLQVGVQWIHLLAVAVWAGGLVWLLVGVRGETGRERAASVRMFSLIAGFAIAIVALTGVARAWDEVGGLTHLDRLINTDFGVALLIKIGLFAAIIVLGARNRYVNVPKFGNDPRRSRALIRTVGAEVIIAVAILAVAGVLSQLPPAAIVAQTTSAPAQQFVVTGNDFATSVKARLIVSPGTVGPNRFRAHVADYDTGAPVPAESVSLRFTLPADPSLGTTTLKLSKTGPGDWSGLGTQLSMAGNWEVEMLVEKPGGSVTIPLDVQVRAPEPRIEVQRRPGQPTIYTISLTNGGELQAYVDPGKAGINNVHLTYLSESGKELHIQKATAKARGTDSRARPLKLMRFSAGHFVANARLAEGRWTFSVDAVDDSGARLTARFTTTVGT